MSKISMNVIKDIFETYLFKDRRHDYADFEIVQLEMFYQIKLVKEPEEEMIERYTETIEKKGLFGTSTKNKETIITKKYQMKLDTIVEVLDLNISAIERTKELAENIQFLNI
jgi:hypothetical protein